uniref:TSA: Wollemia nobilis Ref_Wollemi_Transcript_9968_2150 transcribed RNA sequence n=1 Tax=Wollemia nobilis TaxID=56998 RepID=A0A0C9S715_9CONI
MKGRAESWWSVRGQFLPEESFQSWGNYANALMHTGSRLVDRVFSRSLDVTEITEIRARSGHEMKKTLNWFDLIWFGVGVVIGAGIFVLTGLEARVDAGPAIIISYVISGISALLSVLCYTEFAVEIPVAGSSFAYLRVELGDFVAFVAAGNILFEYVISGAAVARSWTSYFTSLLNHDADDFRIQTSLAENYNKLDPIAIGILIIVGIIAIRSTKATSRLNSVSTIVHILLIIFVIVAGLVKAKPSNYTPFSPFGAKGIFRASSVVFFAYVGFDAVATMAEETKNPAKDIPIGLVGSMAIIITAYCLMAMTLCLMQSYTEIDPNAGYSVAFQKVGMNWAKYIVDLGALIGMTTALLGGVVGQARYLTHIARTHMLPPWFALVHEKTGTPINATATMVLATAIIAFFTELDILAKLVSISTLLIFTLVALALIVRRYYVSGETSTQNQWLLILFIKVILWSSVATAIYWARSNGWICYVITVPIWALATLGLWLLVPQARKPKLWGVPLVPWLPSLSIAINIFLLGSLDSKSFIRFGIWTGILLVYYLLFGLHASYDTAKADKMEKSLKGGVLEDGEDKREVLHSNSDTTY